MPDPGDETARAFLAAARRRLGQGHARLEHCLGQLTEDDLHWRSSEGHNSPANIVVHLCGNLRQWIISGIGGGPDVRDRPAEFADRSRFARDDLLARLRRTVEEADDALARAAPDALLAPRRIQGFDTTALAAILDTVAHFVGHAQEITFITRLRRGDDYVFQWVAPAGPTGAGDGGPPP